MKPTPSLVLLTAFFVFILLFSCATTIRYFPAVKFGVDICPSIQTLKATADPVIRNLLNNDDDQWELVISINMSDPRQNCPSGWSLRSTPRSCSQISAPGCSLTTFAVNNSYRKVRGRAAGIATGSNDAFMAWSSNRSGFNYVDGLNIFLGTAPPQHVWTFAVDQRHEGLPRCPCGEVVDVPDFVGSNYFCDTHESTNLEVWDGVGCSANTCCVFNSPPWFNVSFNTTYTQDIQVRICTDENFSNERISLTELEIFVQ